MSIRWSMTAKEGNEKSVKGLSCLSTCVLTSYFGCCDQFFSSLVNQTKLIFPKILWLDSSNKESNKVHYALSLYLLTRQCGLTVWTHTPTLVLYIKLPPWTPTDDCSCSSSFLCYLTVSPSLLPSIDALFWSAVAVAVGAAAADMETVVVRVFWEWVPSWMTLNGHPKRNIDACGAYEGSSQGY